MDDTCIICCESIQYYTIFKNCQHRNTCWKCTLTNRVIDSNFSCCFCRSISEDVVLSRDPMESFPRDLSSLEYDPVYKVYMTSERIMSDIKNLRRTKCRFCDIHPPSTASLQKHYNHSHMKSLCPHCLENRKVFLSDQKIYNIGEELQQHMIYGEPDDTYGYIDGHPICLFCNERFYGEDELKKHIRELPHYDCFLCKRKGISLVFYRDYVSLKKHFEEKHFMCPHMSCRSLVDQYGVKILNKFTFGRSFELEYHLKTHHSKKRKNINLDLQQLMKDEEMDERSISPDPMMIENGSNSSSSSSSSNPSSSSSSTTNQSSTNGLHHQQQHNVEIGAGTIVFVGVPGRASMGRRHGMDIKNYLSESEFQEFSGKFFKFNKNKKNQQQSGGNHHHHHHHHHNHHNHRQQHRKQHHPSNNHHNNKEKKVKNFRGEKKRDPFLRKVIQDKILTEIEYRILEYTWTEFLTGKIKAVDFFIRFKDLFSLKTAQYYSRHHHRHHHHHQRKRRNNNNNNNTRGKFSRNQKQKRYGNNSNRQSRKSTDDEDVEVEVEEEEKELPLTEIYFPAILNSIQDPKIFEAIKAAKSTCENKEYQNAIRSKYSKMKDELEVEKLKKQDERTKITDQNFPQLKSSASTSSSQQRTSQYSPWKQNHHHNNNNNSSQNKANGGGGKKKKKKKKKKKNKNKGGQNWVNPPHHHPHQPSSRRSDPLRDLQKRDNNPMGGITITVKKKKKKR